MRLYHVSPQKLATLTPTGNDPKAGGVPVVWLTNDPAMQKTDGQGNVIPHQHAVDVDPKDPCLFFDQAFADLMTQEIPGLPTKPSTMRWYWYTKPLAVAEVLTWDANAGKYV